MKNLLDKVKKTIGMEEEKVEVTPTVLMDSILKIGSKHEKHYRPNEDYMAASMVGKKPQVFIGIVSDGCSNGAKTDFGARIICQSLRRIIFERYLIAKTTAKKSKNAQEPNFKDLIEGIDSELEKKIQAIRSTKEWRADDFAATVVISLISATQCYIKIIGDGVIGVRKKNGSFMVASYDWTLNSPYYKFQDLESTSHDTFINNFKEAFDKDQEKQLAKNSYHVRQEFDKDQLLRIHTEVTMEKTILPDSFLFSEPTTEDFKAFFNKYINFGKTKPPGFVYPDDELILIEDEIELEKEKKANYLKKEPQFNESAPEKPEEVPTLEEPIEPEKPNHPALKELIREDFKTEQAWGYEMKKRNEEIYQRKKEMKAYEKKKMEYDDALLGFTRLKIQHQRKLTSFNTKMNKYNNKLERYKRRKKKFDTKYEQYQIGATEYDQRIHNLQKSKNEFIRLKLRHLERLSTKEFFGLYDDPHACHKSNMKWLEVYKKHKREKFLPKEVKDRLQVNILRLEKAITLFSGSLSWTAR